MKRSLRKLATMLMALLGGAMACAQSAPLSPQQPWKGPTNLPAPPPRSAPAFAPDPTKTYTLPELVNLAEQNNPETRVAWENAKARAADLGISKSTLYPTMAAQCLRGPSATTFYLRPTTIRQTIFSFSPALELDYTIFDFGRRLEEIDISRNNLLAANLLFNDTHRKVIYQVMAAYFGCSTPKDWRMLRTPI